MLTSSTSCTVKTKSHKKQSQFYHFAKHKICNASNVVIIFFIQGGPKKVYDRVSSLHLIKNRFFFVIFSFCIPKHTICFKKTFFIHI